MLRRTTESAIPIFRRPASAVSPIHCLRLPYRFQWMRDSTAWPCLTKKCSRIWRNPQIPWVPRFVTPWFRMKVTPLLISEFNLCISDCKLAKKLLIEAENKLMLMTGKRDVVSLIISSIDRILDPYDRGRHCQRSQRGQRTWEGISTDLCWIISSCLLQIRFVLLGSYCVEVNSYDWKVFLEINLFKQIRSIQKIENLRHAPNSTFLTRILLR